MKAKIEAILKKALKTKEVPEVFVPTELAFGHYSTNVAMRRAKEEKRNPLDLAEEIGKLIEKAAPKNFFSRIEVVTPGFINFWLHPRTLQREFDKVSKSVSSFGTNNVGKGKTVIIEYSSPNIAKPMHVGHLRSTIIGDSLARLYATQGYKVIRWNYLGDWGTQFGKMIAAYKLWGKKSEIEKNPVEALLALYVRFHEEAKDNPELEKRGQEEFQKLENGDKENKKLWEWFRKESLKEFEEIYKLLGVQFDIVVGESAYEKDLTLLLLRLKKKGVAKESEGAFIIPLDAYNLPPALIQKSDGASVYLTREIANTEYRIKQYRPVKILIAAGNEQSLYFSQLGAIAEILKLPVRPIHIKNGLVFGEEGKKFSTREGRVVTASEVIEKAVLLAGKVVQKKNPKLPKQKKQVIAHMVGIGALKYNDLKENRHSDITFHWETMLSFSGDSAPYLQYTHARLKSILRKAKKIGHYHPRLLEYEHELEVVRKLLQFPEVVQKSAETNLPNVLAEYTFSLANTVNRFYESTPILKDEVPERMNARLLLVKAAASVIAKALDLLGIGAPEEM